MALLSHEKGSGVLNCGIAVMISWMDARMWRDDSPLHLIGLVITQHFRHIFPGFGNIGDFFFDITRSCIVGGEAEF